MADKKIFELTTGTPTTDYRFAFGKVGFPSLNIAVTDFLTWLNGALSFLKPSSNLGDLADKPTSRTNLEVYSTTETDNLVDGKADVYSDSALDGALKANNTSSYTPTLDYHPATKKYVDDNGGDLLTKGSTLLGDIPAGTTPITVNINDVGTTSYMVVYTIEDSITTSSFSTSIGTKTATSFDLQIKELSAGVQNVTLFYRIHSL